MAASSDDPGIESLRRLKTTDATRWLAPTDDLPAAARAASRHIFSSLKPYAPKSPFEKLLTEGFDHEQIWQQIDLQTQPQLPAIRRQVRRLEKNPTEIRKLRVSENKEEEDDKEKSENLVMENESLGDEFDEEIDDEDEEEEEEDEENEDEEGNDVDSDESGGEFEDQFLKMRDMEHFLDDQEAKEYGLETKEKKKSDENEEEESSDGDEEEDDEDMFGELGIDGDNEDDEGDDKLANARYEDFFGGKKKKPPKRKPMVTGDHEESESDEEHAEDERQTLSTYEKERMKIQSEVEKMEQESLKPQSWNMLGEVTTSQRPKNSALELDLEFEHNVRPPPVITEEITASLEDLIKNRILEGQFDDVQKPLALPSKAPRVLKELDENKSKKGLAEIYEEEYVQKTNLASAPLSFAEEEKQEASMLFKKLCLKLDALSHFHFAPKPIIEDLSLPENVPALAMEEVAPVAVSDAAMLAPEEVFAGKGDIKDETELTQADRKRRRAHKKRKFKAEMAKRMANKPPETKLSNGKIGEATKEVTKKARRAAT